MTDAQAQFFFVSRVVGSKPCETISSVVAESRPRNSARRLTRLLVSDGAQVVQYLDGNEAELDMLVQRLQAAPRHEQLCVLPRPARRTAPVQAVEPGPPHGHRRRWPRVV